MYVVSYTTKLLWWIVQCLWFLRKYNIILTKFRLFFSSGWDQLFCILMFLSIDFLWLNNLFLYFLVFLSVIYCLNENWILKEYWDNRCLIVRKIEYKLSNVEWWNKLHPRSHTNATFEESFHDYQWTSSIVQFDCGFFFFFFFFFFLI